MIHFAVTRQKRTILDDLFAGLGAPLAGVLDVVEYEALAEAERVPAGTWILSDLDGLGPAGRALAAGLRDTLRVAGHRVLNDPRCTLQRLELLQELERRGINRFRAVPIGPSADLESLRYPVFVRGASDHFGPVGGLRRSPDEVREAGEVARAAGIDVDDLIVVEFEDTSDEDGVFLKFGACVVGDRIIPHHAVRSEDWMIKFRSGIFTRENFERERRWAEENPHEERLREVVDLARVEYGRIDYSIRRDGGLAVWEINLCPMIEGSRRTGGHVPDELRRVRAVTKEGFHERFRDAFRALDRGHGPEPVLEFAVGDDVRAAMLDELAPDRGGVMKLLRAKAWFGNW